jgi:hypothetical protein
MADLPRPPPDLQQQPEVVALARCSTIFPARSRNKWIWLCRSRLPLAAIPRNVALCNPATHIMDAPVPRRLLR